MQVSPPVQRYRDETSGGAGLPSSPVGSDSSISICNNLGGGGGGRLNPPPKRFIEDEGG